ncbi:hypothetical protein CANMA_003367 [Candida margitis]|uniref:uncharacterized protein n=1 Tax=Candida margitis TaxID=1775924 RepID=UPI0022277222|nr:uncharacterized protein CANMA_003367 [Candida margitis]KAI5966121.1 hypothetical protein CANMA_003367 [Candida margitis]
MLSLLQISVLVILLAAIANGTPIEKRHDKFIVHELERTEVNLQKRTPSEQQNFFDTGNRWSTKLKLGSSQEAVRVILDTGSYRLNVPGLGATCAKQTCAADAVFHPDRSSTFKNLTEGSDSGYGDGSAITKGYKVNDDLYFDDGRKIPDFEFDVSTVSATEIGLFGVGDTDDEKSNYVFASKHAGLINRAGYSVYLGPNDQGTLLLGGVDKAKYEGELAIFQSEQNINAKSITTPSGKVLPFTKVVGFDTGNNGLSLDKSIVDEVYIELGGSPWGQFLCDRVLNTGRNLTFDLGPINISVPLSNFFYRTKVQPAVCNTFIFDDSNTGGLQGIGLPFLRDVYFVKDLEKKTIGIAPVKHTDDTDIVDFWF